MKIVKSEFIGENDILNDGVHQFTDKIYEVTTRNWLGRETQRIVTQTIYMLNHIRPAHATIPYVYKWEDGEIINNEKVKQQIMKLADDAKLAHDTGQALKMYDDITNSQLLNK